MTAAAATDELALLASIGIQVGAARAGELRAAGARVARRLHAGGHRIVGLVPADDRVAVPAVAIHLGLALCELTGGTVAVVDANVRYPGLMELARGRDADAGSSRFATRWLRDSLALMTPPRATSAGEVVRLARALDAGAGLFGHVLCDLTGFDLLGEHATAAACMDAVAIVGRVHQTRVARLRQLAALMPADRFLGVLLVG
ncbi:MAG: hypothetical protein R2939_03755 [Kofleriaceae bacterium]